jgi:hypothetical protein
MVLKKKIQFKESFRPTKSQRSCGRPSSMADRPNTILLSTSTKQSRTPASLWPCAPVSKPLYYLGKKKMKKIKGIDQTIKI